MNYKKIFFLCVVVGLNGAIIQNYVLNSFHLEPFLLLILKLFPYIAVCIVGKYYFTQKKEYNIMLCLAGLVVINSTYIYLYRYHNFYVLKDVSKIMRIDRVPEPTFISFLMMVVAEFMEAVLVFGIGTSLYKTFKKIYSRRHRLV